jgi:hypothetical protein
MLADRASLGNVSMCECGTIHLSVGGVTVRLAPEAFGEMLRMCQDAADRIMLQADLSPTHSHLAH